MLEGRKTLFIASEVRSGSTWAGELVAYFLSSHSMQSAFGLTHETFRDIGHNSTAEDLANIFDHLWRDESGLATAKIMCSSLSIIVRESLRSAEIHKRFFGPNVRWMVIRRSDRIQQAISLAYAIQSGKYHSYVEDDESQTTPTDPGPVEIFYSLQSILLSDTFLDAFARRLEPNCRIVTTYEEIVDNPEGFLRRVFDVCKWNFPENPGLIDRTKLKPQARLSKKKSAKQFESWFLSEYHEFEDSDN